MEFDDILCLLEIFGFIKFPDIYLKMTKAKVIKRMFKNEYAYLFLMLNFFIFGTKMVLKMDFEE